MTTFILRVRRRVIKGMGANKNRQQINISLMDGSLKAGQEIMPVLKAHDIAAYNTTVQPQGKTDLI